MSWTWSYAGPDGEPVQPVDAGLPADGGFPTQAEAEDWIGATWRDLRAQGVGSVTLHEDDRVVYGPMSLDPA